MKSLGEGLIQFRLRDWGVSRQRYWGCPIPVIYENGDAKLVDENKLPVILPDLHKKFSTNPFKSK